MKLIWHINLGFITLSNKLITFFPPYRAAVAWSIIDSVFVFLRWRGLYRSSNRRRLVWATSVNSCNPQKWSEIETDPAGSLVDTHVAPFQTWSSFDIEWRRIYRDVSACSPVYMSERMMHVQHRMCECLECLKTMSNRSESIFPRLRPKEYTLKGVERGKWRTHSFVPLLMVKSHTASVDAPWCFGYITFTLLMKMSLQFREHLRATFKIWLKWNLQVEWKWKNWWH